MKSQWYFDFQRFGHPPYLLQRFGQDYIHLAHQMSKYMRGMVYNYVKYLTAMPC